MKGAHGCLLVTYSAHRHLVGGEGSRLIGADDRRAAQGLYGGQATNDGVLLGHATRAKSQAGGDDGRKALWDGGHGQGHRYLKVIDGPFDPGATVDGVAEVSDVDDPDGHADEGDDLGELLAKLVQLLLQRRLLLLSRRHLIANLTDLGGNAGSHDDAHSTTRRNVGAL